MKNGKTSEKNNEPEVNAESRKTLWSLFDVIALPFMLFRVLNRSNVPNAEPLSGKKEGSAVDEHEQKSPEKKGQIEPQPGWEKARPAILPKPTYWPFFTALGLAFIFWGLLTTWLILMAGILILIVALYGWIALLRRE